MKREAATWLRETFRVNQRRAWTLELSLGTCRYVGRRDDGRVFVNGCSRLRSNGLDSDTVASGFYSAAKVTGSM